VIAIYDPAHGQNPTSRLVTSNPDRRSRPY
jgi:hypothetical protein